MKLPTGDHDLREDEIEGLVSSSISISPRRRALSSSPGRRSSTWVSSKSVGKQKKLLVFVALIFIALALVAGLKQSGKVATSASAPKSAYADYYDDDADASPINNDDAAASDDDDAFTEETPETKKEESSNANDGNGEKNSGETPGEKQEEDKDTEKPADTDGADENANSDTNDNVEDSIAVGENNGEEQTSSEETTDSQAGGSGKNDEEETNDGSTETTDATPAEETTDESSGTTDATPAEETTDESSETTDETPEVDEEAKKEALAEKWGKWHFWDGDPDSRPKEDFLAAFPNKDCPYDDFPDTAWQADAVYVNHMLDSAGELVSRAKEAIYTEYGYGPRDQLTHDQLKERLGMFKLDLIDLDDDSVVEPKESLQKAGWTTKKSFHGLGRRLIHAMMTNDTFTIVLGGHSAAAGHGNHFLQSYMMQMHKVLEPIFTRVGVKLVIRNIAQGGLGTLQHSLGSASIYGENIDVIVWDSRMTEADRKSIDIFYRQALIGGKRAPVLWGGDFALLKDLYLHADGT